MYVFEREELKSRIKENIRKFFNTKGFVEVDTPLLSPTFIPEHTIKLFKTIKTGEFTTDEDMYLLPSPELYMKRLLSSYKKPIYQISKAFRNAEQSSPIHSNEFTMLEFYLPDADYNDTIALTGELLKSVFSASSDKGLKSMPVITTASRLLEKYTGFSLGEIHERKNQDIIENRFSLSLPADESFDDTFNRIFIHIIEPELSKLTHPIFIKDYPIEIACLARAKNELERERFELYYKGVELANGYSEMSDAEEIMALLKNEMKYFDTDNGIDNKICKYTLEHSSGVAIGLDRLIMLSEDIKDIASLNYS